MVCGTTATAADSKISNRPVTFELNRNHPIRTLHIVMCIGIMYCISVRVSTMDDTNKVEDVQESHTLSLTPSCNAEDITENKDGGLLKEVLKEGAVEEFPLLGDQVTITYDALFADGNRFDSSQFRTDNKFEFILGKGDVQFMQLYFAES